MKNFIIQLKFSHFTHCQNNQCDSTLIKFEQVKLNLFNDTSEMILFYRANDISINVPKWLILQRKSELKMTSSDINSRISYIKSHSLNSSKSDFSFHTGAPYMARRFLDMSNCQVFYNGNLEKSFKKYYYRTRDCKRHIKYEFKPDSTAVIEVELE